MDAKVLAQTYFESWKAEDFETFRSLIDDNVTFKGPMAEVKGVEEYVKGIQGMSKMIDDIVVQKIFVDGADVITWFDIHTKDGKVLPTANWSHVTDGKIDRIRVAFDTRPITS